MPTPCGSSPAARWVAGPTGERVALGVGQVAFFGRGEVHAKGSERGMLALMVQVRDQALDLDHSE